jgi:glycosyltransferase involved in cell wall biosynthesis
VQLLRPRPGKLGLGTAYVHGLRFASGDFVFFLDADLSHHVSHAPCCCPWPVIPNVWTSVMTALLQNVTRADCVLPVFAQPKYIPDFIR